MSFGGPRRRLRAPHPSVSVSSRLDQDPPLSQMNPMRALMQIPLREPPKLSDPAAWSPAFADFLTLCLNREPRKRASIEQLLEHPFVQNCPAQQVLVDLIQAAHAEKARVLAREASGEHDGNADEGDEARLSSAHIPHIASFIFI